MEKKIKVGIIGLGYWGPNLLRNFYNHPQVSVDYICDLDETKLGIYMRKYPYIRRATKNYEELFREDLDIVVVATPPETHYEIIKKAILNSKNVLAAKPLTTSSKECEELIEISKKKNLKIFVDHTFVFNPVTRKIKEIISSNDFGKLIYFDSERVRAPYREGVDVIWDLAVHDFSILLYFGYRIKILDVLATKLYGKTKNDMAHISFLADDSIIGHIYVNWFSPLKIRKMVIGGEDKMIIWDDVNPVEKLRIIYYEEKEKYKKDENPFFPTYVSGDIRILKVENVESLSIEVDEVVKALSQGTKFESDEFFALEIIKILEECDKILLNKM